MFALLHYIWYRCICAGELEPYVQCRFPSDCSYRPHSDNITGNGDCGGLGNSGRYRQSKWKLYHGLV